MWWTRLVSVYAIISVMETIGGIIAGPLIAACYRLALALGGGWSALPFVVSAILFSLMAAILLIVPTGKKEDMASGENL